MKTFLFLAIAFLSAFAFPLSAEETHPRYTTKLHQIPEAEIALGRSLSISSDGQLAALWSDPFHLVVWDKTLKTYQHTDRTEGVIESPADIMFWGQLSLFLCDGWNGSICQYNRRLKMVKHLPYNGESRFEPVSFCLDERGRFYAANSADDRIWTVDVRFGESDVADAQPLFPIPSYLRMIRYDNINDRLVVLEDANVSIYQTNGRPNGRMTYKSPDVVAIACDSTAVWVAGKCLERVPFALDGKRLFFNADTLKVWNVYPVAAIAVDGKGKAFLLSSVGGRLLELSFPPDEFWSE